MYLSLPKTLIFIFCVGNILLSVFNKDDSFIQSSFMKCVIMLDSSLHNFSYVFYVDYQGFNDRISNPNENL